MTALEVEQLRMAVGVRDANRDYNVIVDGHGTGLAPPTEQEWEQMMLEPVVLDQSSVPQGGLESSFDLSARSTFPIVGNQASQGSCAAWAATYYGYGAQEAADNGWTDASTGNPSHLMSAAWTYNKVNGGHDRGSWMGTNMEILLDWGGATLKTMPYHDWDPLQWGDASAFREAPLHRTSNVRYVTFGSAAVDTVKALVTQGIPVTFALDAGEFSSGFADGNYIISAAEYNSLNLNHAQTVVGYDDSISDDGDVGAFRIVNSWSAGWGDAGYYWLTYGAFNEIGVTLSLTYTIDIPNYSPTMLAVWHFNQAPSRGSQFSIGIGPHSSPAREKTPYFETDGGNLFPTFMAMDVSEFKDVYDAGTNSLYLALGSSTPTGTLSSFKVELYEGGYTPGVATQTSAQSSQVPRNTPTDVANAFLYYTPIPIETAMDAVGVPFSSTSWVTWVPVNHHYDYGGSSMQTGDIGDSMSTDLRAMVVGPTVMWFDWKVSSELSTDFLRFGIDGTIQAAISGEVDWRTMSYSLSAGPHILNWEYLKNGALSIGQDTGWIDDLKFDNSPPFTAGDIVGNLGSNGWYTSLVTVTLSASDANGIGVDYTDFRVDGGSWKNYSSAFQVAGDGTHTIDYYSVDKGGNTEQVKQMQAMIDTVNPFTGLNLDGTMGSGGWYQTPINVTMTPLDATSGLDFTAYAVDGLTWQNYSGTFQITADGVHTLEFYSQDMAGNAEPMHSLNLKVDQNAPVTLETESGTIGDNNWYTSEVNVSLASSDSASNVESTMYRVNQGSWRVYSGAVPLTADGVYSIDYYSQDVSGNQEQMRTANVKVDTTPPMLAIDQVTGTAYASSKVTISWVGSDDMSGVGYFETSLDGAAAVNQDASTTSVVLDSLTDGTHTVTVTAVDMAGLRTMKTIDFIVDTKAPVTVAVPSGKSGQNGWFLSNADMTLTAADETTGIDSIKYRIDDGPWMTYPGRFTISQNGRHTVEYYSIDKIGNREGTKNVVVLIDLVAPDLNIVYPTGNVTQSDINASWFAADYESGLADCEVSVDGSPFYSVGTAMNVTEHLADGAHFIVVKAYDVAGNSVEREFDFSVDTSTSTTGAVGIASGPWATYLAFVGLIAALALVLALVLAKRRKKEEDKPIRRSPPPPPPLPPPPPPD